VETWIFLVCVFVSSWVACVVSDDEYTRCSPVKITQTAISFTNSMTTMDRQTLHKGVRFPGLSHPRRLIFRQCTSAAVSHWIIITSVIWEWSLRQVLHDQTETPRWVQRSLNESVRRNSRFIYAPRKHTWQNLLKKYLYRTNANMCKLSETWITQVQFSLNRLRKCQLQKHILFAEEALFTRDGISNCCNTNVRCKQIFNIFRWTCGTILTE